MALFLLRCPPSTSLLRSPTILLPPNPKPSAPAAVAKPIISATLPARDRVIDFGKFNGRKLGTLPSTYLKWVSNNLRARDFHHWAKLADEVLQDPIYRDRIEWEYAQRVLNGDVLSPPSSSLSRPESESSVAALLEISERFGWDNEDKVGWSKVNFDLLGTTDGCRIPRLGNARGRGRGRVRNKGKELGHFGEEGGGEVVEAMGGGEERRERRERMKMKREKMQVAEKEKLGIIGKSEGSFENVVDNGSNGGDNATRLRKDQESQRNRTVENYNPFPGREALLKKVLNRRRLL